MPFRGWWLVQATDWYRDNKTWFPGFGTALKDHPNSKSPLGPTDASIAATVPVPLWLFLPFSFFYLPNTFPLTSPFFSKHSPLCFCHAVAPSFIKELEPTTSGTDLFPCWLRATWLFSTGLIDKPRWVVSFCEMPPGSHKTLLRGSSAGTCGVELCRWEKDPMKWILLLILLWLHLYQQYGEILAISE